MTKPNKTVIFWLLSGCFLLFLMVVVGGITRLTNSEPSITDLHLNTDTFPPMTDTKWHLAFEEYKKFPEYQKINIHNDFTLSDYKFIYFWEWFHRFIGRIIGIVFLIPFLYFLAKKRLDKSTIKKCIILLCLGGFQGFLGWFMVKSGLIDNPDVGHFRLALHLTFAFITFSYTLWVALDLIYPNKDNFYPELRTIARFALVFLIIQIIYGGFVARLNAGLIHNHLPLMSEDLISQDNVLIVNNSFNFNSVKGKSGVQLVHRTTAYLVVVLMIFLYFKSKKYTLSVAQKNGLNTLIIFAFVQFKIVVLTLLFSTPLWLGLAHQTTAFFLLTAMTYTLHRFTK